MLFIYLVRFFHASPFPRLCPTSCSLTSANLHVLTLYVFTVSLVVALAFLFPSQCPTQFVFTNDIAVNSSLEHFLRYTVTRLSHTLLLFIRELPSVVHALQWSRVRFLKNHCWYPFRERNLPLDTHISLQCNVR